MKVFKPHIPDYGYRLGATEEIRAALASLGFRFPNPHINKGCHWGTIYFFNEDLELAKSMIDSSDNHFRIDTETRYFYVSPHTLDIGTYWEFSVVSNKSKKS